MKTWAYEILKEYGKKRVIITIGAILFIVLSFGYDDVTIINSHVISLWKSVFQYHSPFHFYDVSYYDTLTDKAIGKNAVSAMYDFPIYVIEGVWGFPMYLLSVFTGADVAYSWYGILWGKLLHVIFCVFDGYLVYRIAEKMCENDKAVLSSVYFLTSIISFNSVYIIGQCDSIVIAFILAGILSIISGKKITGIIVFSIAMSLKIFAIFPFLVVLLIFEKRISKLFVYLVPGVFFVLLEKLLFRPIDPEALASRSEWLIEHTKLMFESSFPLMSNQIPVFTLLVVVVLCICFLWKKRTVESVVFFIFLVYFAMFISFDVSNYWHMYVLPFYCILLSLIDGYRWEAFVFSLVGEASLGIGYYIRYYWCYEAKNVNRTLLGILVGQGKIDTGFFRFAHLYEISNWMVYGSFYAIFIVCFAMLGIMFYQFISCDKTSIVSTEENPNLWWYNKRIVLRVLFAFVPVLVYLTNRVVA